MYNHKGPAYVRENEYESIYTLDRAFQSLDHIGLPPYPALRAQSAPAVLNPEIKSDPHVDREYIGSTAAQEVSLEYLTQSLRITQKAAKNDLSDLSATGTAGRKGELENTP